MTPTGFSYLFYVHLCATLLGTVLSSEWRHVVRETVYGNVRGFESEVLPGKKVQQFLGVPYAAQPIGELRFEYPEEPPPWNGTLDTLELPPVCMQRNIQYIRHHFSGPVRMSESCLYLNIYVPETSKPDMEVLLWIHGGSNEVGMGAMLTGAVLAARGEIVVVNFNYRLSHLGFLNLNHSAFPGNYGLTDQIAAMKWVRRNIRFFQGDADKVTLAGHSAGGMDVSLHMISNATKGLFRYVIQMSGTSLAYWSLMNPRFESRYREMTQTYLSKLECNHDDIHFVKRCLRKQPATNLSQIQWKNWHHIQHPFTADQSLVPLGPEQGLRQGRAQVLPVMLGFTRDEGGIQAEYMYKKRRDSLTKSSILWQLKYYADVTQPITGFDELVFHEYAYYPDPTTVENMVKTFAKVEGDLAMVVPTLQTARYLYQQYSQQNFSHIYLYNFEFVSPQTFGDIPWLSGVPHGRDLFYLFGIPLIGSDKYNFSSADRNMSAALMDVWISFIKHGYPSYPPRNIDTFRPFDLKDLPLTTFTNEYEGDFLIRTDFKHRMKQFDFWTHVLPALVGSSVATESAAATFSDVVHNLCMTILCVCGFSFVH